MTLDTKARLLREAKEHTRKASISMLQIGGEEAGSVAFARATEDSIRHVLNAVVCLRDVLADVSMLGDQS